MNNKKITKEYIIKQFGYGNAFSKEIFEFYKINEEDLKKNTFRWHIYALKNDELLSNVKSELIP